MAHDSEYVTPLQELGLTGLEAQVYGYLLQRAPATGYGVAKGTGKPVANCYQALASLRERGAVLCDDAQPQSYRAVPPSELFATLEKQFTGRRERAARALSGLDAAAADERMYQLRTPAQVIERLRHMLLRARRVALLELSPWSVDRLARDLAAAAERRIIVALSVAEYVELPGVRVTVTDAARQGANAVVDAREHLSAAVSEDGRVLHRAVWSQSPELSRAVHRTMTSELFYAAVERGLARGISVDELEAAFEDHQAIRAMGTGSFPPG